MFEFVDIHTHLLPRLDDGPRSMEDLLQMLRGAYESGTRRLIATSHMYLDPYNNNDLLKVNDRFARTLSFLNEYAEISDFGFLSEMRLYLGAENYVSPEFIDALSEGHVLTLNGSRYVLLEFSPFFSVAKMELVLSRVYEAGFVAVLAHPERSVVFQQDPERMAHFWEMGCVCQVNADSILGAWGSRIQKTSVSLLNRKLVHVIASDGHDPASRTLHLGRVCERLKEKFAANEIRAWMMENPLSILYDKPLATQQGVRSASDTFTLKRYATK